MPFNVGDVVRVQNNDQLRGGDFAKVMEVVAPRPQHGSIREYVVEFKNPPRKFLGSERFLYCIYREEQLMSQEGL
jgi:hypothetical protein